MSFQECDCPFRIPHKELEFQSRPQRVLNETSACELLQFGDFIVVNGRLTYEEDDSCQNPNLNEEECPIAREYFEEIDAMRKPLVSQD